MPYVKPKNRNIYRGFEDRDAGQLNYMITTLIVDYLLDNGLSYRTINDVVGALDGARAEFYRRVAAPYEDKAIARNGDVYPEQFL